VLTYELLSLDIYALLKTPSSIAQEQGLTGSEFQAKLFCFWLQLEGGTSSRAIDALQSTNLSPNTT